MNAVPAQRASTPARADASRFGSRSSRLPNPASRPELAVVRRISPSLSAHRRQLNARFVESICLRCLKTIAYSPQPEMLAIAEEAHRCGGR